ncbi:MAG: N-acetylmuramoyl-L-alanine amidase [Bacteroidetes bacterium]|nr:N-acetylmuramoyl-L-alanine amidase [Bacteroidota bacterium]HET6245710.1 N-acetylmuramoyl-L-alanine amidase [Bacteroidia bacterium]
MKKIYILSVIIISSFTFIYAQNGRNHEGISPRANKITNDHQRRESPSYIIEWEETNLRKNNEGSYVFLIESPIDFNCFGIGWESSEKGIKPGEFKINYRVKGLDGIWKEWISSDGEVAPEETPTGLYWSELLFTNDATIHSAIEIHLIAYEKAKINFSRVDILNTTNDYAIPEWIEKDKKEETQETLRSSCPTLPTIIPRSDWCGSYTDCHNANYAVTYIDATHIVIHHGASPNTYTDGPSIVRSYWNYHVNTLGWADIGYNYLTDKYGNLYQGRKNPNLPTSDVRGAHAGNANSGSIGISFIGNADVTLPTTVQIDKCTAMMAWWFKHKNLDPTTSAGMTTQAFGYQVKPRICGHLDIGQTSCPGTTLYGQLPNLRTATKAIIDACTTSPDNIPPTTSINTLGNLWQSSDFSLTFNDLDDLSGSGVDLRFYQAMEYTGTEWRANGQNGFFNDNFNSTIHPEWTSHSGTWSIVNGRLLQSDQLNTNSNISTSVNQNNSNSYLYQWSANMNGTGANRRSGLHFFSDNAALANRGNSYLVWFRADDNKIQIYETENNVLSLKVDLALTINANTWYDYKVIYNPLNGKIEVWMDNLLVANWTDPTPLTSGEYISLRNGDSEVQFDNVKVRKSRNATVNITVGPTGGKDIQYESINSTTEACRVNTLIKDVAGNFSSEVAQNIFIDWTFPSTSSSVQESWQTTDFTTEFTDEDNLNGSGIDRRFYQILENQGTEWRANASRGFYSDNFDNAIHTDWTQAKGTWNIAAGKLVQSDENENNSNIFAALTQNLSNRYLYNFQGKIDGSGTNRRAGFHFFSDDASLANRGNSYFIWFRLDDNTLEFYKVTNDVFAQQKVIGININPGQWYDYKIIYDRINGEIKVYRDDENIGNWTDPNPISNGNYISFRGGNSNFEVDNLKIYRTRFPSLTVSVGPGSTNDIRFQNINPTSHAAKIKSIVTDMADNISAIHYNDLRVDWTAPDEINYVNDGTGADINFVNSTTELSANWASSNDENSGIIKYWYSIGTSAGATDGVVWTDNGINTFVSHSGLLLNPGQTYYFNVRAENGAGLYSTVNSSDGQTVDIPAGLKGVNPFISFVALPNPFNSSIQIRFSLTQAQPLKIMMIDMLGKTFMLYNTELQAKGDHNFVVNGKDFSPGVYTLQLITPGGTRQLKIIKAN